MGSWPLPGGLAPGPGIGRFLATHVREAVTAVYLAWAALEVFRLLTGRRRPRAFQLFGVMWKRHVQSSAIE